MVVGKLVLPVLVEVETVQPLVDFGVVVDFVVVAAAAATNAKQCK